MMEGRILGLLVFLQLYQGLMGATTIQVTPEYAVVNPGDDASFMCRVLRDGEVSRDPLSACFFVIGGRNYVFLNQNSSTDNLMYIGAGLDQGECGIKISKVEENLNGNISCSLVTKHSILALEGRMSLVVAIPPQKPKLEVTVASDGKRTYKEKDILSATCIIKEGRPVANISWYLDSESITEGLTMPLENCPLEKKDLCTIQQNLTRTLEASDDKKVLKCVASHHSFKGKDLSDQYTIFVNYPPKQADHPLEFFALVEGAIGRVPITIDANPRPEITWSIDDEQILEGTRNGRYTIEPTVQKVPGEYETVLLIDTLTKEDTDKKYKVIARNEAGETHYLISISTSPEPKVLEMGAGLIIIIIVAILLILLVLGGVFFARAKGKFCFAATGGEKRVASPSEGTENPASNHHSSVEYINDMKKEKPKEDTPV